MSDQRLVSYKSRGLFFRVTKKVRVLSSSFLTLVVNKQNTLPIPQYIKNRCRIRRRYT